jgi:integrase
VFALWTSGINWPDIHERPQYSDAEYFNLSEKDTRIATAQRARKAPTLEQVKHVIQTMLHATEIQRRNRALVAFTLLTGARDSAIASMKLKHVDLIENCVHQDAREVKTKFSKTFTTYFFPVGEEVSQIVAAWVRYLREEKLWGNDDPLFPATYIVLGSARQFEAAGIESVHWNTASPIRTIFREAFERAGLPYFHPHSIRKTLARLTTWSGRGLGMALVAQVLGWERCPPMIMSWCLQPPLGPTGQRSTGPGLRRVVLTRSVSSQPASSRRWR